MEMVDQLTAGIVMVASAECVLVAIVACVQWLSETRWIGGIYGKVAQARKDAAKREAEKQKKQA